MRVTAQACLAVCIVLIAPAAAQASPNIETILRKAPTSEHTDADTLTWLLTFTEPVTHVHPTDFVVSGTTATLRMTPLAMDAEACSVQWAATLSGGDLAVLNGTVTLTPADFREDLHDMCSGSDEPCIWGCRGDGERMTHPGPRGTNDNTFIVNNTTTPPPEDPPPDGGGNGGGGSRTPAPTRPSASRNLTAVGGDGEVVLSWDPPPSDGGAPITDYQYRIDGSGEWISIGSTDTTYTVSGLRNGASYVFEVRAVNRIGPSRAASPVEVTLELLTLDFTHFANGETWITDLVVVNLKDRPARPALYFYDTEGNPIAAESVVDLNTDLEVQQDGGLTVQTEIEPLEVLTISTHGRGDLVTGSVRVASGNPLGGLLRWSVPGTGVAAVGPSPEVRDVTFPARHREASVRRRSSATRERRRCR